MRRRLAVAACVAAVAATGCGEERLTPFEQRSLLEEIDRAREARDPAGVQQAMRRFATQVERLRADGLGDAGAGRLLTGADAAARAAGTPEATATATATPAVSSVPTAGAPSAPPPPAEPERAGRKNRKALEKAAEKLEEEDE